MILITLLICVYRSYDVISLIMNLKNEDSNHIKSLILNT